jgi:hypothetical protein
MVSLIAGTPRLCTSGSSFTAGASARCAGDKLLPMAYQAGAPVMLACSSGWSLFAGDISTSALAVCFVFLEFSVYIYNIYSGPLHK